MEKRKKDYDYRYGRLPDPAPLANPYVPFQTENPPVYDARKAMIRGTMYPGLDLPFKGIVNKKEKPITPLTQMQALGFAIQDLALYLDTHREDREALKVYREYQRMYRHCKEEYQKKYGPTTHFSESQNDGYSWLDDPWPWEYAKNKEV